MSTDWSSTPRARRHCKPLEITLTDCERSTVDRLAQQHDVPRSHVIAAALLLLSERSDATARRALSKIRQGRNKTTQR